MLRPRFGTRQPMAGIVAWGKTKTKYDFVFFFFPNKKRDTHTHIEKKKSKRERIWQHSYHPFLSSIPFGIVGTKRRETILGSRSTAYTPNSI